MPSGALPCSYNQFPPTALLVHVIKSLSFARSTLYLYRMPRDARPAHFSQPRIITVGCEKLTRHFINTLTCGITLQ